MSSSQKKQSEHFIVIFMQEGLSQFTKVKLSIPIYKKIKHIYQYLEREKSNPFKTFFITNKIKERAQFGDQKEIKQIKEQFKKDKQGNYVILCYEDKTKLDTDAKVKTEKKLEVKDEKAAKSQKEQGEKDSCSIM